MLTNKGRNICRIRSDTSLSGAGRKQARDTAALPRATLRDNRTAWKPKNVLAGSRRCFQIKCDDALVVVTPHAAPPTCSETGAPWTTLRWRISNLS
jgi:hypothetical protein